MKSLLALVVLMTAVGVGADDATIEVSGIRISLGMAESEVRFSVPRIHCIEKGPGADPDIERCAIGDGVLPEYDGHVSFEDGRVVGASRYLHLPDAADAFETLRFLNDVLERVTAESGTCAEVVVPEQEWPEISSSLFYFPDKVVYIQTQSMRPPRAPQSFIHEFLRRDPVPAALEAPSGTGDARTCMLVER